MVSVGRGVQGGIVMLGLRYIAGIDTGRAMSFERLTEEHVGEAVDDVDDEEEERMQVFEGR